MAMFEHLRKHFPWFPKIDYDLCRKDLHCLNFCPHDVFEWDPKTGRPIVAHQMHCAPGCTICLEGCDSGALSLPSQQEVHAALYKFHEGEPA